MGAPARQLCRPFRRQSTRPSATSPADGVASTPLLSSEPSSSTATPAKKDPTMKELKKGTSKFLSEALESVSFTIVGDDPDYNWALAQGLGKRLGWFPVDTRRVLLGMLKAGSIEEVEKRDGHEKLVEEEAKMLLGLRTQRRIIVATLPNGATARETTYNALYGTFIIWADQEEKGHPKPATPARAMFAAKAEVKAHLRKSRGFGPSTAASPLDAAEKAAQEALEVLMPELGKHLRSQKDLVLRKQKYVEFGCRGDWPVVRPAGWSAVHDVMGRPEVAFEAEPSLEPQPPVEQTLAQKTLEEWRASKAKL